MKPLVKHILVTVRNTKCCLQEIRIPKCR